MPLRTVERAAHFRAWSVAPSDNESRSARKRTLHEGPQPAHEVELVEDDEAYAAEPVTEDDARPRKKARGDKRVDEPKARPKKMELCLTPIVESIGRPFFRANHILGHRRAKEVTLKPRELSARELEDSSTYEWSVPPDSPRRDSDGRLYYKEVLLNGQRITTEDAVVVIGDEHFKETRAQRLSRQLQETELDSPVRNSKVGRPSAWNLKVRYFYEEDGTAKVHGSWLEKASDTLLGPLGDPREYFLVRRCEDMPLEDVIGKSDIERVGAGQPRPRDHFFYRFIHIPAEATFKDPDEPDLDLLEHRSQLGHHRCKGCLARYLEELAEDEHESGDVDWLRGPDAKPLYGKDEMAGDVGLLVRGQQAYRIGDTVYFRSSDENDLRARLGKIVAICGIAPEPISLDDDMGTTAFQPSIAIRRKLRARPGADNCGKATVTLFEFKRFIDQPASGSFKDEVHLCCPDGTERRRTISAVRLDGHFRILDISDKQYQDLDWLHEHVYSRVDTFFTYSGGLRLPFSLAPSLHRQKVLAQADKNERKYHDLMNTLEGYDASAPRYLRHLDLFAGISAFHVAFKGAGLIDPTGKGSVMIDCDPASAKTLTHNFAKPGATYSKARVICQEANSILRLVHQDKASEVLKDTFSRKGLTSAKLPRPGEVDIITAGFPCQGHSMVNSWAVVGQASNQLAATTMAAVELFKPRYFIGENVRTLIHTELPYLPGSESGLKSVKGGYMRFLVACLLRLGYQVWYGCLQAAHYGTPQSRRRLILMAARQGCTLPAFPRPTHIFRDDFLTLGLHGSESTSHLSRARRSVAPHRTVTVHDAISDLQEFDYTRPPLRGLGDDNDRPGLDPRAKEALSKLERGPIPSYDAMPKQTHAGIVGPEYVKYPREALTIYQETMRRGNRKKMRYHYTAPQGPMNVARIWHVPLKPGADWKALDDYDHFTVPKGMRPGNYGRIDALAPFPTILTRVDPSAHSGIVLHPSQMRLITCLEAQRAQGIPDRIVIKAIYKMDPTSEIYRLIGNSIPVPLCDALARELFKAMVQDWTREGRPGLKLLRQGGQRST